MHVVSASMSRRDLNFPTLGAPRNIPRGTRSPPPSSLPPTFLLSALHRAYSMQLPFPLAPSRLPQSPSSAARLRASTCALEKDIYVCVWHVLRERKNSESLYRKRFLILVAASSFRRERRDFSAPLLSRKRKTRVSHIDRSRSIDVTHKTYATTTRKLFSAKRKECHTFLLFPPLRHSRVASTIFAHAFFFLIARKPTHTFPFPPTRDYLSHFSLVSSFVLESYSIAQYFNERLRVPEI